jgi:hypothetical protein
VPPDWHGELPAGVEKIQSPTVYVWIVGRTLVNGPKDFEAAHKIQDGYGLTPLSQWEKPAPSPIASAVDASVDLKTPPPAQVRQLSAEAYFKYAGELLKIHSPHVTDWSQIARLKRIGLEPDKDFEIAKLDPVSQKALKIAPQSALQSFAAPGPYLDRIIHGWRISTDSIGVYGNFYLKRAVIALIGLGANVPEDAIYPQSVFDADGEPLNGGNRYVLHFDREEIPPVNAFWSITLYDNQGYVIPNSLQRYALGDRSNLKYGEDGSLEIYLQHDTPDGDQESNWLPAPAQGEFVVNLRLYAPKEEAVHGQWVPPAIQRIK